MRVGGMGEMGVVKSNADFKTYRFTQLLNGLRVMLISSLKPGETAESETASDGDASEGWEQEEAICNDDKMPKSPIRKSAAALCINVGYFSDPMEAQGLSHFLEHTVLRFFSWLERNPLEERADANDAPSAALKFVASIVGYEGRGSLVAYLRKLNLAVELNAGCAVNDNADHNQMTSIFGISVELSELGRAAPITVVDHVFSYLRMLRNAADFSLANPSATATPWGDRTFASLVPEFEKIWASNFHFQEPLEPLTNVQTIAMAMQKFPPHEVFIADSLILEPDLKVEALIAANLLEDATMKVEIDRNLKEIFSDRHVFDRRQRSVEILRQLKLSDVQDFYRETYHNLEKQPSLMIQVDALSDVESTDDASSVDGSAKALKTFDWPLCIVPMSGDQAEAERSAALSVDVREAVLACAPSLITDAAKGDPIPEDKSVEVALPRIVEIPEVRDFKHKVLFAPLVAKTVEDSMREEL
ncbi:Nardilysin [Echinococcus granulosus]|uniref:Nardilysin n=1 Tax=Echinococcus granulosus TaxID=6210 RepID=W6UTP1_ECHGR|nr:Nardilysin [Echinococcus granulosus]EUB61747.1 Nardilysin [Echinococcus granulosus]